MVNSKLYINQMRVSYTNKESGQRLLTTALPDLAAVVQALEAMEKGEIGTIELKNTAEYVSMTIFGEPGLYQIGIVEENEDVYYYWNGKEPTGEVVDVGWNTFPQHLICYSYDILTKAAEEFCKNGERLEAVEWIFEEA